MLVKGALQWNSTSIHSVSRYCQCGTASRNLIQLICTGPSDIYLRLRQFTTHYDHYDTSMDTFSWHYYGAVEANVLARRFSGQYDLTHIFNHRLIWSDCITICSSCIKVADGCNISTTKSSLNRQFVKWWQIKSNLSCMNWYTVLHIV